MSSAINITTMPHGDEEQLVRGRIELIDDAIVTHTRAELRPALHTEMWIALQLGAEIADGRLHGGTQLRHKIKEHPIKLARVDFRGLLHWESRFEHTRLSRRQLRLAAFNAGDKVWIQLSLILQIISKPILQLFRLCFWQGKNLVLDRFKCRHGVGGMCAERRRTAALCNFNAVVTP